MGRYKYKGPVPKGFLADNGKEFQVRVLKTNIKSFWLLLLGETKKKIKVQKKSKKLIY